MLRKESPSLSGISASLLSSLEPLVLALAHAHGMGVSSIVFSFVFLIGLYTIFKILRAYVCVFHIYMNAVDVHITTQR